MKNSTLKTMRESINRFVKYLRLCDEDVHLPLCNCNIDTESKTIEIIINGYCIVNGTFKDITDNTLYYVGHDVFNTDFIVEVLRIHSVENIYKLINK